MNSRHLVQREIIVEKWLFGDDIGQLVLEHFRGNALFLRERGAVELFQAGQAFFGASDARVGGIVADIGQLAVQAVLNVAGEEAHTGRHLRIRHHPLFEKGIEKAVDVGSIRCIEGGCGGKGNPVASRHARQDSAYYPDHADAQALSGWFGRPCCQLVWRSERERHTRA